MSTARKISSASPANPTKYCCGFIPVRYVLLFTTAWSLLFSAAFGAVGIVVVKRLDAQLTDLQRIAIFFHIFMSLFFAVICFLGFFACIARRASATSLYTSLIMGQILFSIASGIFCLYLLFNGTSSQPWDAQKCIAAAADQFTRIFCQRSKLLKGLATAMFAIMWLVEIASIFIGNAYLSQLREEALRLEMLDPPKYDRDGNDC